MVVYLEGIKTKYVLVFDIEYDGERIIQFAGILLKRVSKKLPLYQISSNINIYIKKYRISNKIQSLTNLSTEYVNEQGITMKEFKAKLNTFIGSIEPNDLACVSYGVLGDVAILQKNGIDFNKYELWCAYQMAKDIICRKNNMTLGDVAKEAGFAYMPMHNAYFDTLATLWTFSYLLKLDEE